MDNRENHKIFLLSQAPLNFERSPLLTAEIKGIAYPNPQDWKHYFSIHFSANEAESTISPSLLPDAMARKLEEQFGEIPYRYRFMVEDFLRYSPKFLEPIVLNGVSRYAQSDIQIDAIGKVVAIAEKRLRDHRHQALKSIRIVDEDYRPIEQRRFKISEEESVYVRELQSILSPESCLGVAMTYELKSYIEDLRKYDASASVRLDIPIELLQLFEDTTF